MFSGNHSLISQRLLQKTIKILNKMLTNLYKQSFKNISVDLINSTLFRKYEGLKKSLESNQIAPITTIFDEKNLEKIENLAKKVKNYEKVLVMGVGGSSLGGKTLTALKNQNKLRFLESIDTNTIHNALNEIDFKNTFFLVISKSGETIETICQTLIVLDKIKSQKIENYANHFLFVTENDTNSIAKIAKKIGAEIFYHPQNIGGRFSCFSVVGLLPALICDIDIKKVLEGAKIVLQDFLKDKNNFVFKSCASQIALYRQGFKNNVMMPYIDILKNFTDWYRQLWAESLGKNCFGSTPINSMGTVDQHSQLQLYLEGPKDKFFTFFTLKNHPHNLTVPDLKDCETLFGGKNLSQIVKIEQETTIETLNRKKLPIRIFEIENLNEEVLGGLMMQMFLETILLANYENINPFDQPAVELRKDLAKQMLKDL